MPTFGINWIGPQNVGINPSYVPTQPQGRWVWIPDVPRAPYYPPAWPGRGYEVWC